MYIGELDIYCVVQISRPRVIITVSRIIVYRSRTTESASAQLYTPTFVIRPKTSSDL